MTLATCSYCGTQSDSRLVKPVGPPDFPDGGVACYGCRAELVEIDDMHEADRIDAARWRALRPYLHCDERLVGTWLWMDVVMAAKGWAVEQAVDMLVQIAQEKNDAGTH